ncbi:Protein T09B9.2 [Aphelenchoides avenae]|nr:Protein T09B9.2 [Aphelenchus avenae]
MYNGVASFGLAICLAVAPVFSVEQRLWAIVVLCFAMVFAGMHTPGVQTALLQLAPVYTGLLNGIAFGCVAIVSIGNKIMTAYIIEFDSVAAWTLVFEISAVVAFLPVVFFTIWGSADRQPWASQRQSTTAVRDNEVMLDCEVRSS